MGLHGWRNSYKNWLVLPIPIRCIFFLVAHAISAPQLNTIDIESFWDRWPSEKFPWKHVSDDKTRWKDSCWFVGWVGNPESSNWMLQHTFLEMVLRLLIAPLPDLTNLPLLCKQDRFREDTPTFNHLQFQDTRMYLLNSLGMVKASSYDCTLLWGWSNSKLTFKAYITTHTYKDLFNVIMWLR